MVMETLEMILHGFIRLAMMLFEYIGVGVITASGIQGIINYVRHRSDTKIVLAKGLAMGLEFKLGSEILRTVVVRNLEEIYIVAGIVILRAILAVLIHWEIVTEEKEMRLQQHIAREQAADAQDAPEEKARRVRTAQETEKE